MKRDWAVICLLNIIGCVAGNKVKIYGLDVQFDGSSSLDTLTLTSTWEGQPNFLTGKLVINRSAHTVEAIITANNTQLFKLIGKYKQYNDRFMVEAIISSKFHTGPTEGNLEVSLHDQHNPMLKLTPKNGQPMELSVKLTTLNTQRLIELSGNYENTKLEGNIALESHNLHKMKGAVNIAEGSTTKFDLDIDTVDLPHSLEIFPASKAGITISRFQDALSSMHDTFFLEGDYVLWKKLNLNSNHGNFSSFKIDTMLNNMLRVELNHEELFQQTSAPHYPKTNGYKSVKAPLMLPLGDEGEYNLDIESDSLRKNTVNLEVILEATNMISVTWDTLHLSNMMLKAEWFRDI